jgi:hypothetical protein
METRDGLPARLRAFHFPGGEEAARLVRAVKTTQRGEMRTTPEARWMPFTAEEEIDATRSRFRWDARFQGGALGVTDAYEDGHGRLVIKLGGVIPVKRMTGPDFDRGELERYLASVMSCPPMLLGNRSLEWTAAGPSTLRVRDRDDRTGATVDLEIGDDGRPLVCRANRPRLVGKQSVPTPWSGTCTESREWEGLRVASRIEAAWQLPEGEFTYFRAEVTSFQVVSVSSPKA